MRSVTLDIQDNEYDFFMGLVKKFDFVTVIDRKNATKRKQEFLEGLKEAVAEVNLAKEGKIKLKSAEELLHEL